MQVDGMELIEETRVRQVTDLTPEYWPARCVIERRYVTAWMTDGDEKSTTVAHHADSPCHCGRVRTGACSLLCTRYHIPQVET